MTDRERELFIAILRGDSPFLDNFASSMTDATPRHTPDPLLESPLPPHKPTPEGEPEPEP